MFTSASVGKGTQAFIAVVVDHIRFQIIDDRFRDLHAFRLVPLIALVGSLARITDTRETCRRFEGVQFLHRLADVLSEGIGIPEARRVQDDVELAQVAAGMQVMVHGTDVFSERQIHHPSGLVP